MEQKNVMIRTVLIMMDVQAYVKLSLVFHVQMREVEPATEYVLVEMDS